MLIDNPVSAAPGFQIGNVFVMAGVPSIMRAMFDGLKGRLAGGAPVLSRTVSGLSRRRRHRQGPGRAAGALSATRDRQLSLLPPGPATAPASCCAAPIWLDRRCRRRGASRADPRARRRADRGRARGALAAGEFTQQMVPAGCDGNHLAPSLAAVAQPQQPIGRLPQREYIAPVARLEIGMGEMYHRIEMPALGGQGGRQADALADGYDAVVAPMDEDDVARRAGKAMAAKVEGAEIVVQLRRQVGDQAFCGVRVLVGEQRLDRSSLPALAKARGRRYRRRCRPSAGQRWPAA